MIRAEADGRPDLRLVHDRDGRAAALRPRLRLPRRADRRRPAAARGDRGGRPARLVPGAGVRSLPPWRRAPARGLPALSLAALLVAVFWLQPRTMSYVGLNLMLNLAVPIALATIAQMCVITVNELDLGIGTYVGFVACVAATWLVETPLLGRGGAGRRHPGLCRPGCADPAAQPALDRGDAGHVVRLARPVGADPAHARRQGAGMGALADDPEAALRAAADHRRRGDRPGRPLRADAHLLRCHPARRRRQSEGDRAGRLVAAHRQDGDVRRWPASSACWRAWR